MPGKTNGKKPNQNGVNGNKDIDMKDDAKPAKDERVKKSKDGDEEMTVVVPPPKGSRLSTPPRADDDGDINMGDAQGEGANEPEIDPVAKTVASKQIQRLSLEFSRLTHHARYQE